MEDDVEGITVKDKILNFMSTKSSANTNDIVARLKVSRVHASVVLNQLLKMNKIRRIKTGVYSINDNDVLSSHSIYGKNSNVSTKIEDLDIETLLMLKNKYGKEQLVRKLKDAIKLLD